MPGILNCVEEIFCVVGRCLCVLDGARHSMEDSLLLGSSWNDCVVGRCLCVRHSMEDSLVRLTPCDS